VGVTELDNRLKRNASITKQQTQALRNAVAEVNRLKRAVKAGGKERDRLAKDRKRAVAKAGRAQAKYESAESKYDRSVLADMVRREKARDRADAARPPVDTTGKVLEPAPDRSPATTAAKTAAAKTAAAARTGAGSATGTGGTTVADPPPERTDRGTATSTRTAARKTAADAGVRTPRGS